MSPEGDERKADTGTAADRKSGWSRAVNWIELSLCEKGEPSSARLLTYYLYLMASIWITNYFVDTHKLPDGGTLGGLAAFCSSPYGLRAFASAIADRNGN